jgi:hypothetical protein
MQNRLDNGKLLYTEYTDTSGFIIREIEHTKNPVFRFQAGRYVNEPMKLPVYNARSVLSHHIEGDNITKFLLLGNGRTKMQALNQAADHLLSLEIENHY